MLERNADNGTGYNAKQLGLLGKGVCPKRNERGVYDPRLAY